MIKLSEDTRYKAEVGVKCKPSDTLGILKFENGLTELSLVCEAPGVWQPEITDCYRKSFPNILI